MGATEIRDARLGLRRIVEEARVIAQTDRPRALTMLEVPVVSLSKALIRYKCRDLPAFADLEDISSRATEMVWKAIQRVDFGLEVDQIVRFFSAKAEHAVSDAAREADPLPRRVRGYRKLLLESIREHAGQLSDATLGAVAVSMFPSITPRTLELVVHGAPPIVNAERDDLAHMLFADESSDPEFRAVETAVVDALHIAMADGRDALLREWAARVLCGEIEPRRIPACLAPEVCLVRSQLSAAVG
jgi:hypothetical protein